MKGTENRGGAGSGRPLRGILTATAVLVFLLAACGGNESQQGPEGTVVALVNGQPIGLREYREKLAEQLALAEGEKPLKPADRERLKEAVLNRLVEETILLQRARELSLAVSEADLSARIEEMKGEYKAEEFSALFGEDRISFPLWREALRRRILLERLVEQDVNAGIVIGEREARKYYDRHRKEYQTQRRVRAAQIVVRDARRARDILKRLKAGEDFGKVARALSIGPEAARGGDLGFFEPGRMPDAIDRVVFALPVGQLSGVVESPYGYHIFKVLEREAGGRTTYAAVRERVVAALRRVKEDEAYEAWLAGLKGKAVIEIARPLPDLPPEEPEEP